MNHGPREKKERSLGVRLGIKGERCASPKCAMVRKPYKPGVHGPKGRPKALSEFGLQMREKSKVKAVYGIAEKSLKHIFDNAVIAKGALGTEMMATLERRLDNVIFRLGFAPSRGAARQMVTHGHITVNGRKVTSPGFAVKVGNKIAAKVGSAEKAIFGNRKETLAKHDAPAWLRLDAAKLEGEVLALPADTETPFEINLLVEAFSK